MPDNKKKTRSNSLFINIRKIFTLNIGTVLFGVLFLYMLFSAILYLTSSHVSTYQVISGPLSSNETYTGLVIREDTVVQADGSGYVNYYAREGNKINANGIVYGLSSGKTQTGSQQLGAEDLAKIQNQMSNFSYGFNSSHFNDTYNFKYDLEGSILQYAGAGTINTTDTGDSEESEEDEEDPEDPSSEDVSVVTVAGQSLRYAPSDGIILYSQDGYEGKTVETVTEEDFNQNSYHREDLKTDGEISAGDPVYSIISDERWSLLIPLSEKQAARLVDRTSIRVKFLKDGMDQLGDFSIIEIDGKKYGKLDFNKGLIRYASDRFLDIELVTNTQSGLKIPLSSVVTKEFYVIPSEYADVDEESGNVGFTRVTSDKSGKTTTEFVDATIYAEVAEETQTDETSGEDPQTLYYVDMKNFQEGDAIQKPDSSDTYIMGETEVLEGVYCINEGYAVFRRIIVSDQNEEYAIVEKGTPYGLVRYDHIVLDASTVNEEDILYR
ncbi:hypothetical protein B5F53_04505 [Blautia sp. An249]|uniref:HlyD family efflux transporter periplasmic adaptor subunit n=1 Tax=Blautia sp. An249 TaxID=1965603 RepID=UPI000B38ED85|nr:HlyD family efflux transporter periplasmic adaptor subunit [Blautia sp. An249]OUO80229.1 hypothetical protein B5F53_04505 [Blautia sp. An249]